MELKNAAIAETAKTQIGSIRGSIAILAGEAR